MKPTIAPRISISLLLLLFCAVPLAAQAVGGGRIVPGEAVRGMLAPRGPAGWGTQYDEWTLATRDTGMITIRVETAAFRPMVAFGRVTGGGFEAQGWFVNYERESAQLQRFVVVRQPYVIRVGTDSAGRGGAYTLTVVRGTPARPLEVAQAVTGSIDGPDPETSDGPMYNSYHYDDWAVTPAAADSLEIRMYADLYDPRIAFGTVENGRFREVARARSGPDRMARLVVRPEPGRRYVIRAGGTDPSSGLSGYGAYTLHVGTAGTLRAAFAGVLSRVAPDPAVENWRFTAVAGDTVTIQVDSAAFATTVQFGEMRGDEFHLVAQREGMAREPARLVVSPSAGGDYEIRVRSRESGPYTLRVIRGAVMEGAGAASTTGDAPPR